MFNVSLRFRMTEAQFSVYEDEVSGLGMGWRRFRVKIPKRLLIY